MPVPGQVSLSLVCAAAVCLSLCLPLFFPRRQRTQSAFYSPSLSFSLNQWVSYLISSSCHFPTPYVRPWIVGGLRYTSLSTDGVDLVIVLR
ncbi:hypothetical protein QBC45DRAFT_145180 [Copromyces sp. CBS 386.78]|nr:hypothetical protein QBC45DRAFT_145180 [Copromyces sp. CBS 386.78]